VGGKISRGKNAPDKNSTTITITKKEYKELKKKAEISEGLLVKLVKGLEEIKEGRFKPFKEK